MKNLPRAASCFVIYFVACFFILSLISIFPASDLAISTPHILINSCVSAIACTIASWMMKRTSEKVERGNSEKSEPPTNGISWVEANVISPPFLILYVMFLSLLIYILGNVVPGWEFLKNPKTYISRSILCMAVWYSTNLILLKVAEGRAR